MRIYIYVSFYELQEAICKQKHFSEVTSEMGATVGRGARFHPTVGIATPDGFTTSHPRAETTMQLRLRLPVYQ
jgi:hypothetical protein